MCVETTPTFSVIDLPQAAREFAAEVAGCSERKKKAIPSPPGLQMFLLYVRAKGSVPSHQVTGAITVQTVLGHVTLTVEDRSYEMAEGRVLPIGAGAPHAVFAGQESVLLVTHALQSKPEASNGRP